jgi:hypothetical protein
MSYSVPAATTAAMPERAELRLVTNACWPACPLPHGPHVTMTTAAPFVWFQGCPPQEDRSRLLYADCSIPSFGFMQVILGSVYSQTSVKAYSSSVAVLASPPWAPSTSGKVRARAGCRSQRVHKSRAPAPPPPTSLLPPRLNRSLSLCRSNIISS